MIVSAPALVHGHNLPRLPPGCPQLHPHVPFPAPDPEVGASSSGVATTLERAADVHGARTPSSSPPHLTSPAPRPRRRYNNMGRVIRGQRKGPGGIFKVRQRRRARGARGTRQLRGKHRNARARVVLVCRVKRVGRRGVLMSSSFKPAAWEGSIRQDQRGGGSTPGHAWTTRCPRAASSFFRANKGSGFAPRRKQQEDVSAGEHYGGSSWGGTSLCWWLCCDGFCADAVLRMRVPTR